MRQKRSAQQFREARQQCQRGGFVELVNRRDAEAGKIQFARHAAQCAEPARDLGAAEGGVRDEVAHLAIEFLGGSPPPE